MAGEVSERVTFCIHCAQVFPWGLHWCPSCGGAQYEKAPTKTQYSEWRAWFLKRLRVFASSGVEQVEWQTAHDTDVCPKCRAREGRPFTIDEMRAEIEGSFCIPAHAEGRCRCAIRPWRGA